MERDFGATSARILEQLADRPFQGSLDPTRMADRKRASIAWLALEARMALHRSSSLLRRWNPKQAKKENTKKLALIVRPASGRLELAKDGSSGKFTCMA